jgi:hypothetical protein
MVPESIRSTLAALLLAALFCPGVTFASTTTLTPTGGDDTAQLQAALDACSGAALPCHIELAAGIFHTDLLLVQDFRGHISGQGVTRTIVRPLVGERLRSTRRPFLGDPTADQPYPVLIHFANGADVTVGDFTLEFPGTMRVQTWHLGSLTTQDALLSAIMVDGDDTDTARLVARRLQIVAADVPQDVTFGSNVLNAFRFEGQIRTGHPRDETGTATALGSGEFVAEDVVIRRTGLGFALRDATHVQVNIAKNDVDARFIGVFLTDLGASRATVTGNRVASELVGIQLLRGVRPHDEPSTFEIFDNTVSINHQGTGLFGPGDGIVFVDITVFADPAGAGGIDTADILDNRISLGVGTFDAVFVLGDRGHVSVARNRLTGPALDGGVVVTDSRGTRVVDNVFDGFAPAPDVLLLPSASDCVVIQPGATVVDLGINNSVTT